VQTCVRDEGSTGALRIEPAVTVIVVGTTTAFRAVIDGEPVEVTWSVSGGGSIAPDGLYTAPLAVPDPAGVTVKATTTKEPVQTAVATAVVTSDGTELITRLNAPTTTGQLIAERLPPANDVVAHLNSATTALRVDGGFVTPTVTLNNGVVRVTSTMPGNAGLNVDAMPPDDTTSMSAYVRLGNRELGGGRHAWAIYHGAPGGPTPANAFDIWEYDSVGCGGGGICRSRFRIAANTGDTTLAPGGGNVGIGKVPTTTLDVNGNVAISGTLNVTGTKNFVQAHPTDPTVDLVYVALEGGEAGTYWRGTAKLSKGRARVKLPEHFGLVTAREGLTVQVTPSAGCRGWVAVAKKTPSEIQLQEQGHADDCEVDYLVQGVRAGFERFEVRRPKGLAAAPQKALK
jgi:hypothetical protein